MVYTVRHRIDSIESFLSDLCGLCIDLGQNDAYIPPEITKNNMSFFYAA